MYQIGLMGGDGTGPEVVAEGVKVLNAAAKKTGLELHYTDLPYGGERYKATGKIIDDDEVQALRQFDTIYLGAIGHPEVAPGILEKGLLLKVRFDLDQYINLRPVKLFEGVDCPLKDKGPADIDFVVVRENTEGIYTGAGGFQYKGTPQEVSTQVNLTTRFGAERCLRYAFELTRQRKAQGKPGKLTLCAKTNVLTYVHDTWWRAFNEVGDADYPDLQRDYAHVDATCMWFVKNPEWFDVIVTDNQLGDIITDLGAMIQGGMGIAAGGNINPQGVSMFEPIGGSAPKYTGKNVINPLAAICAGQMMLETLAAKSGPDAAKAAAAAALIDTAVQTALKSGQIKSMSAGKMGMGTREVGDYVASLV